MLHSLYRIIPALALSMLLHLLPFLSDLSADSGHTPQPRPSLQATLKPAPKAASAAPELALKPESVTKPRTEAPEKPAKPTVDRKKPLRTWTQSVREQFVAQQAQGLFYPQTAIDQGMEGEVLVLMVLDASGEVIGARVEQGSGYPLLDQAALLAVRRLHTLPGDAPSQAVLPVRFRLR